MAHDLQLISLIFHTIVMLNLAMRKASSNFWAGILLTLLLTGCGGSDSDGETPNSIFVNAGADRTVNEQASVQLSGEAQGQTETLTYSWSVAPVLTIDHPDTSFADASFVAPTLTEARQYTFTLRVNDGNGNSATDSVVMTVEPVNDLPIADITLTQWPTLAPNVYPAGVEITLDASGSIDPDNSASNAIVAYEWQQLAGTNVVENVVVDTAMLVIATPITNQPQSLSFSLTVTDNENAQSSAEISINIQSASDTQPTVDAGLDHMVFSGESIILDGLAESSVPRALPLEVLWRNDSGIAVDINATDSAQTYAAAPDVEQATDIQFSFVVRDQFGNEVEDTLLINVQLQPLVVINDTGVLQQASIDQVDNQHLNDYPGQDGQRGQDRIADNGLLEKAGRGEAGFDFTRLNQNGDEVDDVNLPWRCVRDNITGYVWEIKTQDTGLHANTNTYSWYQPNDNGGYTGELNGANTSCTLTECNTAAFTDAVNEEGLCGFFDWRLPTHDELLSIVHFGRTQAPLVDINYFPFTGDPSDAPLWYWTRQPNADGVQGDSAQTSWAIDFVAGTDNFINKDSAARIRLVRAGRP